MQVTGILILFRKMCYSRLDTDYHTRHLKLQKQVPKRKKDGIKVVVRVKNTGAVPGKRSSPGLLVKNGSGRM